jgi:hypothetical protein
MTFLTELVTGKDNKTHDFVRWGGVIGTLHGLGMSTYDVVANHAHFSLQEYGVGLGALLGACGFALGMKKDTEPQPGNDQNESAPSN